MRCPTPCVRCREVVELSDMRASRGGLGPLVCVECWQDELEDEEIEEDDYE